MAKDRSLLILIWVFGEFFIEKQYDGAVELEAQLSISRTVPKLPGLSEPCVLSCGMVLTVHKPSKLLVRVRDSELGWWMVQTGAKEMIIQIVTGISMA